MRVAVAEDIDRDAGREIEITLALFAVEIASLAADRARRWARIDGHARRNGHGRTAPLNDSAVGCRCYSQRLFKGQSRALIGTPMRGNVRQPGIEKAAS